MFEQLHTTYTTRKMQRLFLSFIFGMVTIIALALSANPQHERIHANNTLDQNKHWRVQSLHTAPTVPMQSTADAVALSTPPVALPE